MLPSVLFRLIQRLGPDAPLKLLVADTAAIPYLVNVRLQARHNGNKFGWYLAVWAKHYLKHGSDLPRGRWQLKNILKCGTLDNKHTYASKEITGMDMSGDADDSPPDKKENEKPPEKMCNRCNAPMLLSKIGKFGDQPAYDIYRCSACGYAEWVEVR